MSAETGKRVLKEETVPWEWDVEDCPGCGSCNTEEINVGDPDSMGRYSAGRMYCKDCGCKGDPFEI